MSKFSVPVVKIKDIQPIYGCDAIELAVVGDYRSVVKKGHFDVGDLAVYIPEAALVPHWLLVEINLVGKLAGADKNRVKAIKLRGCLSQGILMQVGDDGTGHPGVEYPVLDDSGIVQGITRSFVKEGDNVADLFGITKWEPVIPASMAGEVYAAGQHLTVPYDIENFKRFPDVIAENEEVIFTEKLHGTFCGVGILPTHNHDSKHYKGEFVVFSKGLGAKGLCFKDAPANDSNVYVRCLNKLGIFDSLRTLREHMEEDSGLPFDKPLFVLGEIFGGNVQDNGWYGNDLQFRIFDVCAGYRGDQWYFGYEGRLLVANQLKVSTVPTLYEGPFSKELMIKYTSGKETVSGKQLNMREGLVVTPIVERRDSELGRVILKSVSEEYLLRKGGSEFN